jgi:glycyl-tRNA synthetase
MRSIDLEPMSHFVDFQSIIMTLQRFWAEQGCLIWQPYYTQVGAGTMTPATALRVLGPEPWYVAYVEPSIRPDDGRYGENPNRMQMHYQFQVILKPDPGNPQDLYLRSLEALGIDLRAHDVRFVEDNWESPALGAWGLGWEVWLDGQEITQFTYFQQAGGRLCDPVSVELTYGLDRIAIALQRVHGFTEIRWNQAFTCGDVNLQAEQEHSRYYFEVADIQRLRQMYDLFEAEAEAALAHGLVLPAHDYLLKCSHTFNILDTRGAIGVTERQAYFARMRDLARRVADVYLEQRQQLEYPFLEKSASLQLFPAAKRGAAEKANIFVPTSPSSFLLEIGTEELPSGDLTAALEQLSERVPAMLEELRLSYGSLRVSGTPRRLVVYIEDLAPYQEDVEQVVKGPPAERAYDAAGQPTQAALGFARSKGVSLSDLQVREMDGGRYVVALVRQKGEAALSVLSAYLPRLIASLRFEKSMRWNESNVAFSRPIRWLLALYGDRVVPFEYAGLSSGNLTYGLRFQEPEQKEVQSAQEYFAYLSEQGILLEVERRKEAIRSQISHLADEVGGEVQDDPDLLAEVANMVEAPLGLRGTFDPSHLELPREVLIAVMKKHQRYFPIEKDNKLLPYFITFANKSPRDEHVSAALIVEGNEHVIRARFSDAAFFVREDLKRPLEAYLPRLRTLAFQADLGSMWDKSQRICRLVERLGEQLGLNPEVRSVARRAAELCKADLVTKMVVEMTSLQGVMGRYYALRSGESDSVATAIFEHYLPRFAGDIAPTTLAGLVVGLADRLDTLAGLFALGLAPTGAKDPFAQRRAALGLVQNLIAWKMDFDLKKALQYATELLPVAMSEENRTACLNFIIDRLYHFLLEKGYPYDVLQAVLAVQGHNPARAIQAVEELSRWVQREDWRSILPAYARCLRIIRHAAISMDKAVNPNLFVEPEEQLLYSALLRAEEAVVSPASVDAFLRAFLPMIPAINDFFDRVLVMSEDERLRENRLALMQRIVNLADGIADLSKLEGF